MKVKKQLSYYLELRGLTASDLSRMSGVPKQRISDWLGGVIPRDIQSLKKVTDVLSITIDDLCFGDDPKEVYEFPFLI